MNRNGTVSIIVKIFFYFKTVQRYTNGYNTQFCNKQTRSKHQFLMYLKINKYEFFAGKACECTENYAMMQLVQNTSHKVIKETGFSSSIMIRIMKLNFIKSALNSKNFLCISYLYFRKPIMSELWPRV